jgi:hypothetical protein
MTTTHKYDLHLTLKKHHPDDRKLLEISPFSKINCEKIECESGEMDDAAYAFKLLSTDAAFTFSVQAQDDFIIAITSDQIIQIGWAAYVVGSPTDVKVSDGVPTATKCFIKAADQELVGDDAYKGLTLYNADNTAEFSNIDAFNDVTKELTLATALATFAGNYFIVEPYAIRIGKAMMLHGGLEGKLVAIAMKGLTTTPANVRMAFAGMQADA